MSNFEVSWKSLTFTRLLVTFLLILTPIFVLGILLIGWSSKTITKDILNSMQNESSFYLKTLDDDIRRIKDLQFDCYNDEDMNILANGAELLNDYDRTKAINRIQQRLTTIKNSSSYIKIASVHIPPINLTINSLGSKIGSICDLSESGFSLSNYQKINVSNPIFYRGNSLFLSAIFPAEITKNRIPRFIIDIELSSNTIKNALIQSEQNNESRFLLIDLDSDFIIANSDKIDLPSNLHNLLKTQSENTQSGTARVEINGVKSLLVYKSSEYSRLTLVRYQPEDEILKPVKKIKFWFQALIMLGIVIIAAYSLSSYKFIHKPLGELVKSFKKVESGDFNIRIDHERKGEFGYLYKRFNEMVENLKALIEQVYKQKILAQRAELKQLQSQINPHFLYNSYFLLHRMIKKGDTGNAVNFSKLIGTYFEFITRSGTDEVSLSKEAEHARIYAEIQAMRFEDRISVEFESVPKDLAEVLVPRLILQPIIENSFEHGLENKRENGLLKVWFEKTDGGFGIFVEDNGEDLNENEFEELRNNLISYEEVKENTGIINIHKRIQLMYGNESGVRISRGSSGEFRLCIEIKTDINNRRDVNVQTINS